jgi:hypothetical protein
VQFGGNRLAPDDSQETPNSRRCTFSAEILYSVGTDNTLTKPTPTSPKRRGIVQFQSLADLAKHPFRTGRSHSRRHSRIRDRACSKSAFFAQAEWRPRPTMTVTTGLRWDSTKFLDTSRRDTLVERARARTDRAGDWRTIQPRAEWCGT